MLRVKAEVIQYHLFNFLLFKVIVQYFLFCIRNYLSVYLFAYSIQSLPAFEVSTFSASIIII